MELLTRVRRGCSGPGFPTRITCFLPHFCVCAGVTAGVTAGVFAGVIAGVTAGVTAGVFAGVAGAAAENGRASEGGSRHVGGVDMRDTV